MTARDSFVETQVQCCGNCGNGTPRKTGFVNCQFLPRYESMAPSAPCSIGRWTEETDLTKAKKLAQEGIDRAVEAADREVEGWSDLALRYIRLYAMLNRGKKFIGHDIVKASENDKIIQPPNPKAWGGAIQRAARAGYIVKIGFAEDPNRHGNPVPQWSTPLEPQP